MQRDAEMQYLTTLFAISQGQLSPYSDGLRAGWPGFDFRQRQEIFFPLLHNVQTGSRAHSASYPIATGSLPRGKSSLGVKLTSI
jgi:hypothetical protein